MVSILSRMADHIMTDCAYLDTHRWGEKLVILRRAAIVLRHAEVFHQSHLEGAGRCGSDTAGDIARTKTRLRQIIRDQIAHIRWALQKKSVPFRDREDACGQIRTELFILYRVMEEEEFQAMLGKSGKKLWQNTSRLSGPH